MMDNITFNFVRELTANETLAVCGAGQKPSEPPQKPPIVPGDNPLDPDPGIPC